MIQLDSDTLKTFRIVQSKLHFYKVVNVAYDSLAKLKLPKETDSIWNEIKPVEGLIPPTKTTDVVKTGKTRYSIIYPDKKGFISVNYIKRHFGYEMYFSKHEVKKKEVIESVKRDTTDYFMLYAFTLDDLSNLKKLKDFKDITEAESEALAMVYQNCTDKNIKLVKGNKTFGMAFDGYESSGIIEGRELIIKSLIELKYNPVLTDENDFELFFQKLLPKLKRKR